MSTKLTIGILSWKDHRTLLNTLESYKHFGLNKLADEKIIFFQEISKTDEEIAKKYGYETLGSPENIGIADAYKYLVTSATGEFFLFLENDWMLLDYPDKEIEKGLKILAHRYADVVRYRHRKFPGSPLWSMQFKDVEEQHPTHLLDAVHWSETPENFKGIHRGPYDYFYATAQNANWTNNPTMFRTWWLKNVVLPHISGDIEANFQEKWETWDGAIVAQGNGLFTHRRIG